MDHPPPPANAEAAADAGLKESSVNVVRETARPVRSTDQHWGSFTACQSADENQNVAIKRLTPIVVSNVWRCMEKRLKVLIKKFQCLSKHILRRLTLGVSPSNALVIFLGSDNGTILLSSVRFCKLQFCIMNFHIRKQFIFK